MDILSQAKSGMGKTAVFVLSTLQQIEPVDGEVWIYIKFYQVSKEGFLPRPRKSFTRKITPFVSQNRFTRYWVSLRLYLNVHLGDGWLKHAGLPVISDNTFVQIQSEVLHSSVLLNI